MKNYFHYLAIFSLISVWSTTSVAAAGLLSSEAAQSADPDALLAEVAVFKGMREGLTLSVMQCESTGDCAVAADTGEVQQVINAINSRIGGLEQRQVDAGNSAGLDDVLAAYGNEKGGLTRLLRKIESTPRSVIENIDEDELFGDGESGDAEKAESSEQLNDMFADEDEEL